MCLCVAITEMIGNGSNHADHFSECHTHTARAGHSPPPPPLSLCMGTGGSEEDYAAAVGLLRYDATVSSGVGLPHRSLPEPSAYAALLQVRCSLCVCSCLSVCLSVCVSVRLCVCLSVCLSVARARAHSVWL